MVTISEFLEEEYNVPDDYSLNDAKDDLMEATSKLEMAVNSYEEEKIDEESLINKELDSRTKFILAKAKYRQHEFGEGVVEKIRKIGKNNESIRANQNIGVERENFYDELKEEMTDNEELELMVDIQELSRRYFEAHREMVEQLEESIPVYGEDVMPDSKHYERMKER